MSNQDFTVLITCITGALIPASAAIGVGLGEILAPEFHPYFVLILHLLIH